MIVDAMHLTQYWVGKRGRWYHRVKSQELLNGRGRSQRNIPISTSWNNRADQTRLRIKMLQVKKKKQMCTFYSLILTTQKCKYEKLHKTNA